MFPKSGIPFVDWHTALTEAATGDTAALDARLAELESLIRAFAALRRQDFDTAIAEIETMLPGLVRISGSRAQLDLVEATLLKACLAAGCPEDASRVLACHRPGTMPLAVVHH